LRNYENKTYHYPQAGGGQGRELPMVGAHPSWGAINNGCDSGGEHL